MAAKLRFIGALRADFTVPQGHYTQTSVRRERALRYSVAYVREECLTWFCWFSPISPGS
jgi:hypothetical protein